MYCVLYGLEMFSLMHIFPRVADRSNSLSLNVSFGLHKKIASHTAYLCSVAKTSQGVVGLLKYPLIFNKVRRFTPRRDISPDPAMRVLHANIVDMITWTPSFLAVHAHIGVFVLLAFVHVSVVSSYKIDPGELANATGNRSRQWVIERFRHLVHGRVNLLSPCTFLAVLHSKHQQLGQFNENARGLVSGWLRNMILAEYGAATASECHIWLNFLAATLEP